MKPWQIGTAIAGAGLAAVGISAIATNPGPEAYEAYAAARLATVLTSECEDLARKEDVPGWAKVLQGALQGRCSTLVERTQPALQRAIADNTERRNYLFLSVYRTELAVPELIPGQSGYRLEAETIGLYRNFIIRKAEQK